MVPTSIRQNEMKNIHLILLLIASMACGCGNDKKDVSDAVLENAVVEEQVASKILDDNVDFSIQEMAKMGKFLICMVGTSAPAYIRYDVCNFTKAKAFGTIGRGHGEWIKPHLIPTSSDSYEIWDNGRNRIFQYRNDTLVGDVELKTKLPANNPMLINREYGGFSCIEQDKISLVVYDAKTYRSTDRYCFEDEKQKGNAIYQDFVWNGEGNTIILAHLYKKEFHIMDLDCNGVISHCVKYACDYEFNPEEHVYYSDARIHNGLIYLLCQQNVNPETGDGYSEIDIYDTTGKSVKKIVLDVVAPLFEVFDDNVWLADIDGNIRICPNKAI